LSQALLSSLTSASSQSEKPNYVRNFFSLPYSKLPSAPAKVFAKALHRLVANCYCNRCLPGAHTNMSELIIVAKVDGLHLLSNDISYCKSRGHVLLDEEMNVLFKRYKIPAVRFVILLLCCINKQLINIRPIDWRDKYHRHR
jgi:hypothetical protein